MTQEQFDTLPLLLTRKQFIKATGLSRHQLMALKLSGEIAVVKLPARPYYRKKKRVEAKLSYCKYRKLDAARLAGLRV